MNKKVVIIAGLLVIVIVLSIGGYFGWKKLHTQTQDISRQESKIESKPEQEKNDISKRPGEYITYDAAKYTHALDGKVVLFFNAKWSKTCKMLDAELKANVAKIPSNLTIMSVDYDKNYALRKQYQVPFEDTYVQIDSNGTMVNRWSGSESLAEIVALSR